MKCSSKWQAAVVRYDTIWWLALPVHASPCSQGQYQHIFHIFYLVPVLAYSKPDQYILIIIKTLGSQCLHDERLVILSLNH